jgi:putative ABC transport system permease protein
MFKYYSKLAVLSFIKNPLISLLMISAIGLGIGASMTTLTLNHLMSANPISHKNDVLFHVQLDSWDSNKAFQEPNIPPDQVTWLDATNLMKEKKAYRQTAVATGNLIIQPEGVESKPFIAAARFAYADFFTMFDTPFLYGSSWISSNDENIDLVVVLSKKVNEEVYGGRNSVGETLKIGKNNYKVIGVLDNWELKPKFFDLTNGAFSEMEDIYIPFTLKEAYELQGSGTTRCWKQSKGESFKARLLSECINYQLWVELRNENEKADYLEFLKSYVLQQKEAGRFPRPMNNKLKNVMEWMEDQQVVSDDVKILMWIAFMFLFVCIVNTVGLLLSKFTGKVTEISLRRAVGASKVDVFIQHIIESAFIGVIGGILGLVLTWLGLNGIKSMYGQNINDLAQLDFGLTIFTILFALISSVLAGLYPTWRACHTLPAEQLKK